MSDRSRPLYTIGVVAEMVRMHPQTLRMYEKKGLIRPSRTEGKTRMYSAEDVEEIERVTRLVRELGVNLAGIEIILKLRRRMLDMQARIEELTDHVRSDMTEMRDEAQRGKSEALVRAASSQLSPVDLF
jgi:MerR family transcriptional regulator/heat shock protein HspR